MKKDIKTNIKHTGVFSYFLEFLLPLVVFFECDFATVGFSFAIPKFACHFGVVIRYTWGYV